jgi:hypothetical protein
MNAANVRRNIQRFIADGADGKNPKGRNPKGRNASFDFCFNYFQSFHDQGNIAGICDSGNLQRSCLELGFYLASWGMFRPTSFLHKCSASFYKGVIQAIVGFDRKLWKVDVDSYTDENINLLLRAKETLRGALGKATDALITKIMLGVFGNVPAFDRYFRKGLGVRSMTGPNLKRIATFYEQHKEPINERSLYTLDFLSGKETKRRYTKAKIVDMVGVMEGRRLADSRRATRRLIEPI